MCKYCEKREVKDESGNEDLVDLLVDDLDVMACISSISPIAKRRHPDCGGELQIYFDEATTSIPIKYCPMCGREL